MNVAGQLALVTGAGSGIGRAIAIALAMSGARVVATDVDRTALDGLLAEAKERQLSILTESLDVTDCDQWNELANSYPNVTILINNAGVGFWGDAFNTPRRAWDRIIAINILGVVNGCEAFGRQMVANGRPACILNVASVASMAPIPNLSAYSASKFAVEGYSDVLAMELADTPVEVITLHPGIINTAIVHDRSASAQNITDEQMNKVQRYYTSKGCSPEKVAHDVVAGIRAGRPRIVTGPQSGISQFMRHFVPVKLKRKLARQGARQIGYLPD